MPSNQKNYSLDIQLGGHLDPSLARAVGMSEKQLKELEDAIKTVNKAVGKQAEAWLNVAPEIDKAESSMKRFAETAAGVFTGEAILGAVEQVIGSIENGIRRVVDVAKQASAMASQFQQKELGIGNLLRNRPFANQLMGQLQGIANYSPFQLSELATTARSLAARGVGQNDLLETTKEIGDVVAGLGGGEGELNRATLAYGEALSGGTITTREINQLTQLGVPVWDQLKKMTGTTVEELRKLIEKHGLSSEYIKKIFYDITHGEGLFTDAMKNFAETFQGILTTFEDKVSIIMRGLGDVVNDWTGQFLNWINNSGVWDSAKMWLDTARGWSDSVRTFFTTIAGPEMMQHLEAAGTVYSNIFKRMLGGFNPTTMFDEVRNPATGNIEQVLNASGDQWIHNMTKGFDAAIDKLKELGTRIDGISTRLAPVVGFFEKIASSLNQIDDILYGKIVPFLWDKMLPVFDRIAKFLGLNGPLADARGPGTADQNKLDEHWRKYDELTGATKDQTDAVQKNTDAILNMQPPGVGGNYGLHGGFSGGSTSDFTVYGPGVAGDQPGGPTYDSDSYHGIGHIQGKPYNLNSEGPAPTAMSYDYATGHYHIKPGDTYISDKDRKQHRWMDTTGSKNPSNEDVYTPNGSASVNVHYHVYAMDSQDVNRFLEQHGPTVDDHVRRAFGDDLERAAVV